jgi:hypothetical protein
VQPLLRPRPGDRLPRPASGLLSFEPRSRPPTSTVTPPGRGQLLVVSGLRYPAAESAPIRARRGAPPSSPQARRGSGSAAANCRPRPAGRPPSYPICQYLCVPAARTLPPEPVACARSSACTPFQPGSRRGGQSWRGQSAPACRTAAAA